MKQDLINIQKMFQSKVLKDTKYELPFMNNRIIEDLVNKESIITACCMPDCFGIKIPILEQYYWIFDYNTQLIKGYPKLSHSYCPPDFEIEMQKVNDYNKK